MAKNFCLLVFLARFTGLALSGMILMIPAQGQKAKYRPLYKNSPAGPLVSVFVSSSAGDRLKRKTSLSFISNKNSNRHPISIDESIRYQRIDGFGATFNEAGMICLNSLAPAIQKQVLSSLFDSEGGAGFSLMKSPMAACDFSAAGPWYSYDDMRGDTGLTGFTIKRDLDKNGLISFIRKASEFGRFSIETTMDFAPDWMMLGLANGKKHIRPEYYGVLARYYSLYLQSYASQGISIDYLNPFNEPDNIWYSNISYAEIREMIKNYIGPQLQNDGLSTKIQICEAANRPEGIQKFPIVLEDPESAKYINSLTVHGYDWNRFSSLSDLHRQYPEFPIWQTEVCYASPNNIPDNGPAKLPVYEFEDGEFWGNMLMNDLKNWVSGWIYWNMILDQNGGPWLISDEHGDPDNNHQQPVVIINRDSGKVSYTGLYYYLAHFSRFIRPGAYRIGCTANDSQLNLVAFMNKDGSRVVNIINKGSESENELLWNKKMIIVKLQAHSVTTLKWEGQVK